MEYIVPTVKSKDFSSAPKADISCYKWGAGYEPRAFGQIIYIENTGFAVRMTAYESNPKTVYHNYGESVYKDSCLEFFVSFNPDRKEYMNFEMNSSGAFLAALRVSRSDKTPIDRLAPLPKVTAFSSGDAWGTEVLFDLDFIEALFGKRDFKKGDCFSGNFYKCGDETAVPHFGMWSPVGTDTPDFHRPEYFGKFIID